MLRYLLAVMLLSSSALGAGWPYWRTPPANCATPSASCSFANPTITGAATFSGSTAPQIDSTSSNPFRLQSRAGASADGAFQFFAYNSITSGYIIRVGEKAGTAVEDKMTLDHRGNLRLYPDGIDGGGIEMFGKLAQSNGGSDGPIIIWGGVNTTAFASRLLSVRKAVGDVQVWNIRSDGTEQKTGVPTGSLGLCNGSAEGGNQYDSTVKADKLCDGTAWRQYVYWIPFDGSQDPGSIAAQTCIDFTISATGVVDADVLACDRPSGLTAGLMASCTSGTDVIGWRICNPTAGAIDPPNGTYRARVIRP